ncbi:MAG: fasciclin domain-containing protein [Sphingomonas sp.]|nr:fasciclin domain-containing protein [Sphingomonas sp.]
MINTSRLLAAAAAAALATIPAAAVAGSGNSGNIVAGAIKSKNHQTLVAAVKAAGLVDTLAGGGPFTVFAPTDAAFAKLPAGTVETLLQPANRDRLRAVLTYHVVPGKVTAAQLVKLIEENGGRAAMTTVQGGTLTASLSGGSVVITDASGNAARVTAADLVQSNGVIHVTDSVSLPM